LVVWVVELILGFLGGAISRNAPVIGFLFRLLEYAVGLFFQMNLIKIALEIFDGRPARLEDLFTIPAHWLSYLIAGIIVGIVVGIGFVIFIIPGLYMLARWLFYGYAIVDRGANATDSLGVSWQMTSGHVLGMILLVVALLVINLIGALIFGVGLLISAPVSLMAVTYAYRTLQRPAESVRAEELSYR
ncbi:MAG TPA: hypothetical protein VFZ25_16405, partial [Chloroflexota bacterium]|nr:hypothetical protein [Chloroflexota bacterium]